MKRPARRPVVSGVQGGENRRAPHSDAASGLFKPSSPRWGPLEPAGDRRSLARKWRAEGPGRLPRRPWPSPLVEPLEPTTRTARQDAKQVTFQELTFRAVAL